MPEIHPIPVLGDNYVWAVVDAGRSAAVVVDPGDAIPVQRWLEKRHLELAAILVTHHHSDHTAGCLPLVNGTKTPVYTPARESVHGTTHPVAEGDVVHLDRLGLSLKVLEVPGHTAGHVAFFGEGIVLSGDTLFAGGCGRVFEGTLEQMYLSLTRLAALPNDTLVCCAHEYTVANLTFARDVEPENTALAARLDEARWARREGRPTVPSTIALERATNPFLRCDIAPVREAASRHAGSPTAPGAETFATIRKWKDGWRGPR